MRIVFFGNADFGIPSLERLTSSRHHIAAVVTNPDKLQGRGKKPGPTPIKKRALSLELSVLEAENLNSEEVYGQVSNLEAELFLVIAYRILPERIFGLPPQGTVNLHASLLPKYRGAAPIRWALIKGEPKTGVTTFLIEKRVDTGKMILQKETAIGDEESYGELYQRLSHLGAQAVLETVEKIELGEVELISQDPGQATPAPKITKELGKIDWNQDAVRICNLVRALSPRPGAFTFYQGKILKILKGRAGNGESEAGQTGVITAADPKNGLRVCCHMGEVQVITLQLEGKSPLPAEEFLRGYRMKAGERLD